MPLRGPVNLSETQGPWPTPGGTAAGGQPVHASTLSSSLPSSHLPVPNPAPGTNYIGIGDPAATEFGGPQPPIGRTTSQAGTVPQYATTPPEMPIPFHSSRSNGASPHVEPLQIILNSDRLVCRGVAGNLEPALLSGHVVLTLSEATNIRDISLSLIGKARIPTGESRTAATSLNHSLNPIIFTHNWSFLPGDGHKHTIKEGRHVFPFQLELDAALPASMTCQHLGAEVYYKLRATAVRSAFSANFHAMKPVFIVKAFSFESLEFNQSLEVENTWPGKIMYSIMIPHKAYAAGDAIPALLRFTPTAKGVSVLSVGMELNESVTLRWRYQPDVNATRMMASAKYTIKDGKAVKAPSPFSNTTDSHHQAQSSAPSGSGQPDSAPVTPPAEGGGQKKFGQGSRSTSFKNLMSLVGHSSSSSNGSSGRNQHGPLAADLSLSPANSRPVSRSTSSAALTALGMSGSRTPPAMFALTSGQTTPSPLTSPRETPSSSRQPSQEDIRNTLTMASTRTEATHSSASSSSGREAAPASSTVIDAEVPASGDDEISTRISLKIPLNTTPSHSSSASTSSSSNNSERYPLPMSVSHKVRFNVMLSNLDGHTSELRCALPVHILDHSLLREARAATRVTRDVLLGRRSRRRPRRIGSDQLGDAAPDDLGVDFDDIGAEDADDNGVDDEDDDYNDEDEEDDAPIELPSYNSHVLDRVANADIPTFGSDGPNVGIYVTNSLTGTPQGTSSSVNNSGGYFAIPTRTATTSGSASPRHVTSSPEQSRPSSSRGRSSGGSTPLAFDEELMLSLGEVAAASSSSPSSTNTSTQRGSSSWVMSSSSASSASARTGGWSGFRSPTNGGSRATSRANSRANSRASSPEPRERERDGAGRDHQHQHPGRSDTDVSSASGSTSTGTSAGPGPKHSKSTGIFHLPSSLKPLSTLTGLGHHRPAGSLSNLSMGARQTRSRPSSPTRDRDRDRATRSARNSPPLPLPTSLSAAQARDDALSRVPSYGISSRGFLGGGAPPLQLYRDLPSYDEAESARTSPAAELGAPAAITTQTHAGEDALSPTLSGMTRSQSAMDLSSFRRQTGHA